MASFLSVFKGAVIKLAEYHTSRDGTSTLLSRMQILTPAGAIDVNLTDLWYPTLKVGDLVECEEGGGWFDDGRLISYAKGRMEVNGVRYKEEEDD